MSLNRVTLIGRMVRDPELRTTNTGKNVVEFSLAVQKRIKPTDPNQPDADFFRVTAWNQTADYVSQYGAKGRLAAVDGRLQSRKYVDKDGNNRELVEIVADNVNLLDRQEQGAAGGEGGGYSSGNPQSGGAQPPASGGYASTPRSQGGGGQRPAAQPARGNAPSADEYDPFADE